MSEDDITPHPNITPLQPRQAIAVAVEAVEGKPPRITAAGRGALAEEILAAAFANGIKVREDADLAEMLAVLDADTAIPPEAIMAVAEILAKVYEAHQKLGGDLSAVPPAASPDLTQPQ